MHNMMTDKSDRRESGATYKQFSQSSVTIILNDRNTLPYCDQSDSDADVTLHGGPTQQQIYLDGPPEHQTSRQTQQHSLQQHTSV
jgi:hypothetical protein